MDSSQADPLTGTVVAERYEVLERVATGGMGTVYRARQRGLERFIALKVLRPDLSVDRETITRFHREAKAMSLLTHPNTVRVFDFGGTPDGLLYLAMEFLEGELLTQRIAREGTLHPLTCAQFVLQILASLHEAHSKGIIHRDLKPDNIFLARVDGHGDPVVKVLDFGIAKIVHGDQRIDQLETQAGMVFGTPRYMSPEQAQGQALDARTDLYSVGVLAYHMLAGRPPYEDADAVVVMAKHIRERALPIRVAAPGSRVPKNLERAVLQALEKDRERRYASARAFATVIEASLGDAGRRAPRFSRWLLSALAAASLLFLASLVTAGLLAARNGHRARTTPSTNPAPHAASAPRAVAAPDPPPTNLTTRIESEPPGADVIVEGELAGTTPYEAPENSNEALRATLRLDGYAPEQVEVEAGETRSVSLTRQNPRVRRSETRMRRPSRPTQPRPRSTRPERPRARPAAMTARRPPAAAMKTRRPTAMRQAPRPARPAPEPSPPPDPYERW